MKFVFIFTFSLFICTNASAWSLKTHLWIAQQVLNDVLDDGSLTIDGKQYKVPSHVKKALNNHPGAFRMGCIGPDGFPDPIVGQTIIHPGLKNGWKTDDWLRHILIHAKTDKEIAFAYGFVIHACSDIFAHTYVNTFAGDLFELTDETEVEQRHFSLEKYVENFTPKLKDNNGKVIDWTKSLDAPSSFIRNKIIFDDKTNHQFNKSAFGYHLSAMKSSKMAVEKLAELNKKVIDEFSKWAAPYVAEMEFFTKNLGIAKEALKGSKEVLKLENDLLKERENIQKQAITALKKAESIKANHPSLISLEVEKLKKQAKLVKQAKKKLSSVRKSVKKKKNKLEDKIDDLSDDIAEFACGLLPGPLRKECNKARKKLKKARSKLKKAKRKLGKKIDKAEEKYDNALSLEKRIINKISKLEKELEKAKQQIDSEILQAKIDIANKELELQKEIQKDKIDKVEKAQKLIKQIEENIADLNPLIKTINDLIDQFDPISILIKNWLKGIDKACFEYVQTSESVAKNMVLSKGNPLDEYLNWFSGYGSVFLGNPIQVAEFKIAASDELKSIKDQYDALISGLPEEVKWLINPVGQLKKELIAQIKPTLKEAGNSFLVFLTDESTAEFISIVSDPESLTKEKLNSIFSTDNSGKGLLVFDNVSALIEKDMHVKNGEFNGSEFGPVFNSVQLSKLALLSPSALNQLVKNYVGAYDSPYFKNEVFESDEKNYTLLLNAVKNIDGNHQWQTYGLPYPRKSKVTSATKELSFGHDYFNNPNKGFRLWVDPYIREKAFYSILSGSVMGCISEIPELNYPQYNYPQCAQNPFPSTQNRYGVLMKQDLRCTEFLNPNQPIDESGLKTQEDNKDYYFEYKCNDEVRKCTEIASFGSRAAAEKYLGIVTLKYPDLHLKLVNMREWKPRKISSFIEKVNSGKYTKQGIKDARSGKPWRVICAMSSNEVIANEARDRSIRRKVSKAPVVRKCHISWVELKEKEEIIWIRYSSKETSSVLCR